MKRLTRHARVLVTDGGRAIVLRNEGDVSHPDLRMVRQYGNGTPPNRELARDRPATTHESNSPRRSAAEQMDYHQQAEDRFVAQMAADMDADLKTGAFEELIVVAPPDALAAYRKAASPGLARATMMEINKDLTKHTNAKIAEIVVKALEAD